MQNKIKERVGENIKNTGLMTDTVSDLKKNTCITQEMTYEDE